MRQLYNHALHEFTKIPEDEGTLRQRVWQVRDDLPRLKQQWTDLKEVYSTVLQKAVERIRTNISSLSRKEYEPNNWEKQRRRVAEVHARMLNKKRDYKHKLTHFYATEYDAVFVENLNVKSMLEGDGNARNKAEVGWSDFRRILEHHCDKYGMHYVAGTSTGYQT